jgi:hypothetical protein
MAIAGRANSAAILKALSTLRELSAKLLVVLIFNGQYVLVAE